MIRPSVHCRMLLAHCVRRACSWILDRAGSRIETRIAMIPMTTSSSTRVKPDRRSEIGLEEVRRQGKLLGIGPAPQTTRRPAWGRRIEHHSKRGNGFNLTRFDAIINLLAGHRGRCVKPTVAV